MMQQFKGKEMKEPIQSSTLKPNLHQFPEARALTTKRKFDEEVESIQKRLKISDFEREIDRSHPETPPPVLESMANAANSLENCSEINNHDSLQEYLSRSQDNERAPSNPPCLSPAIPLSELPIVHIADPVVYHQPALTLPVNHPQIVNILPSRPPYPQILDNRNQRVVTRPIPRPPPFVDPRHAPNPALWYMGHGDWNGAYPHPFPPAVSYNNYLLSQCNPDINPLWPLVPYGSPNRLP